MLCKHAGLSLITITSIKSQGWCCKRQIQENSWGLLKPHQLNIKPHGQKGTLSQNTRLRSWKTPDINFWPQCTDTCMNTYKYYPIRTCTHTKVKLKTLLGEMEFNNSEINFCKSGGITEIQTGILWLFDVYCFGMNKSMIWLD